MKAAVKNLKYTESLPITAQTGKVNNLITILTIVVPCYNEEEALPETARRLLDKIKHLISCNVISGKSNIVFIDDGSNDSTWKLIEKYHNENPRNVLGIKLSKNKGHQNALLCGLLTVKDCTDAAISIDADLQDDTDVIERMIEKYCEGYEVVYGVRSARGKDSFFKKTTAEGFYRFMNFLGADIVYNHADFRLLGKRALTALSEYKEVNLFLRGLIPKIGYKSCVEYYERAERFAGTSKYPLRRMLKFAFEGITSLSTRPIRFITMFGIIIFAISIIMICYFFVRHFTGHTIVGWSSIVCSLWAIGGLILLSVGIVGEYIGKIYLETKARPRYHIEEFLNNE